MHTSLDSVQLTVIRPQGALNASNSVEFQRELTTAVAKAGNHMVVVDFQAVESLDSAGLMALVSALKLAQSLNRRFSLCNLSQSLRIIFDLTQLDLVFEIIEGEAVPAAVA